MTNFTCDYLIQNNATLKAANILIEKEKMIKENDLKL